MKRILVVAATLLPVAAMAQSQSSTDITMTGCVSAKPDANGRYTFDNADGVSRYRLTGRKLKQFAGQRVELVGARADGGGLAVPENEPQRRYTARLSGIPVARSKYRPPRRQVERIVPGHQTALTTGPAGEEIHTNEHGQVTAKFHWDRESPADDPRHVDPTAYAGTTILSMTDIERMMTKDKASQPELRVVEHAAPGPAGTSVSREMLGVVALVALITGAVIGAGAAWIILR